MLDSFLLSWLVFPPLALTLFLGCGLLVQRLGRIPIPGVYLLPLGFATVLAVSALFTHFGTTAKLTGPALVVLGLVGLAIEGRRLRPPRDGVAAMAWPALAAFAGFAVIAAPVVLSGPAAMFTGYSRIVDIAHQFDLAAWLSSNGRALPVAADSSYHEVVNKLLSFSYPGGWQGAHGSLARTMGIDLAGVYQPFIALTSAMGALALYGLLRTAIEQPAMRALAAAVSIQPNVLYAYGLVGGLKELAAASLLVLVAALIAEESPARGGRLPIVPVGVALAASLTNLSLTILPWLGILLPGLFLVALWKRDARVRTILAWAGVATVALVIAFPTVRDAVQIAPGAAKAEGGSAAERTVVADLGNLAAPMPARAGAGVWLSRDYRFPTRVEARETDALLIIVVALALIGAAAAVKRRDWALALLLVSSTLALAYFSARTGPWLQLKAIAITGSAVLACAFAGAAALTGLRARRRLGLAAGWILTLTVSAGVLAGNGLAYHDTSLAPRDRLEDLQRLGERYAGEGPTLYPAFEEHAEYFLRRADATSMVNQPPAGNKGFQARPEAIAAREGMPFAWDLDELEPNWVQSFSLVVMRRGPSASRPPSNWELAERTRYHEVWRKRDSGDHVLHHEPLPSLRAEDPVTFCRRFTARVRKAAKDGPARLLYKRHPARARLSLAQTEHPAGWVPTTSGALGVRGPGLARGSLRVGETGRYEVWVGGTFSRAVVISIDGRPVGQLQNRQNYPEQYESAGEVQLASGRHEIELERGGGDLAPGNGAEGLMGPVVLVRVDDDRERIRSAPLRHAAEACKNKTDLDWIEVVRR